MSPLERSKKAIAILVEILNSNEIVQSSQKNQLDDSVSLIEGLSNNMVEKEIVPKITDRFFNDFGVRYESVDRLIRDLVAMGSCTKRWNHLLRNSKFNGVLRLATRKMEDINEDLSTIEGARLLRGEHIPLLFQDCMSGLPEIPQIGTLPLHDLGRVQSYWRDLTPDDKETLLRRFQ